MFYKDGLEFECQKCLYCCSTEPGFVFLSDYDIERLSKGLEVDRDTFLSLYTRLVDYGTHYLVSLKEKKNYDCEFLTPQGCSVYESRPEQCRTYPFWPAIMESRSKWDEEAHYCRGINKGRKIRKEEIEEYLRRGQENPPFIIFKKK